MAWVEVQRELEEVQGEEQEVQGEKQEVQGGVEEVQGGVEEVRGGVEEVRGGVEEVQGAGRGAGRGREGAGRLHGGGAPFVEIELVFESMDILDDSEDTDQEVGASRGDDYSSVCSWCILDKESWSHLMPSN